MAKSGFYTNAFGNVFGNMIATPVGRAALVWLNKPSEKFKPAKYGCHILFPKSETHTDWTNTLKPGLDLIMNQLQEMLNQK